MRTATFSIVLLAWALGCAAADDAPAYEATSSYEKQTLHGFTVLVSQRVKEHPGPAGDALKLLDEKLAEINAIVPKEPLEKLKKTQIWVEWEMVKTSAACAHHSPDWLKRNGRNPEKVGTIEISNTKLFLAWTPKTQPMMVLHELAHYYHIHQSGEEGRKAILAAFKEAQKAGNYQSVEYTHGGQKRAYALNNENEYFAELTEAYFGLNDFYPFNYDDLEKHDATGFALMKKLWGEIDRSVKVSVKNASAGEASLYWVQPDNALKFYRKLSAGESYEQNTFAGHRWIAVFADGKGGSYFSAPRSTGTWTIQ